MNNSNILTVTQAENFCRTLSGVSFAKIDRVNYKPPRVQIYVGGSAKSNEVKELMKKRFPSVKWKIKGIGKK